MKLHERNLICETHSKDLRPLGMEQYQIDHNLPSDMVEWVFFGEVMYWVALHLKRNRCLRPTAVVDEWTRPEPAIPPIKLSYYCPNGSSSKGTNKHIGI